MIRTRARVLVLFLLIGTLAGCTSLSAGEPSPDDAVVPSTEQPGTTSSAQPTRPRELPLDNVDPCTLLPQADYADYYLDKPGKAGTTDKGAADCLWSGDVGYMAVALVTYEGVEAQEDRFGELAPTEPIDDFPTYTITLPNDENACSIAVDVADGQYLYSQVGLDARPAEVTSVCDYARQFAASIMSTLLK
ncbi:DUF3558 domain-containing protein [Actinophytocola xanthii]|uniref:DUF3558 domain-containing protein n=1 Tax=Actinophytocola xanthii TaxID=1912961 RepID=A0A1Q8CQW4_9PSEU|nr:DUF3558 domain-containing protein [Actinophytocola xanthii]OLF16748.1 hypothetical protein BU204_14865 [Actinophytocola xanthii]